MQGLIRGARTCQELLKIEILKHWHGKETVIRKNILPHFGCVTSSPSIQEKGLENLTVADVLMTKGDKKVGSWLWCHTNDTVYDAVKNMAENNIGSLVVLKPGDQHIAGIITERDYLRKIIAQERSSKYTQVAEIMTDENKLITVSSDTNILKAMQLMTDHHVRHVPVIDGKIVGMISIVDVVRAVVEQQKGEVKRLNEFIRGEYY
ncbi:CBS domain-containing protein CBSX3, mitochondrial [Jatropha curcas]|uniref:CBS domain-containing protein CBSX3, mitochondrial n=1 Tax=Jatropha curcas TaxID=180498 RepID=UPI0005FAEEF1|nr:CBS domain-containing protein CBSX3, mitochondrial [Jatropha curcas]XP_020534838.1 CBS domain-containing protein CBSX3, mitochondrial [Jatropha curcas]